MTRLRAMTYCAVSFVAGMLLLWLTWQMGVMHGRIIKGSEMILFEQDFLNAMASKTPFQWGQYKLIPHTHEQAALAKRVRH